MFNSPKAFLKGMQSVFSRIYGGDNFSTTAPFVHQIASTTDKENYHLFDVIGAITEWIDTIETEVGRDFDYEIKNKEWTNSILINRFTLEDSKATIGNDMIIWIQSLGQKWSNFQDKLIDSLIENNGLAFDGTAFFADTRPNLEGSNTIDNSLAGNGVTLSNLDTDLGAARDRLRGFKDRIGDPLNANPKYIVWSSPTLETKFKQLQNGETIDLGSGAITNQFQGTFELVIGDFFTDTNDWYLINGNNPFKPFIFQTRQQPKFKFKDVEDVKKIKYWSESRSNAGYGNPTSIVRTVNG